MVYCNTIKTNQNLSGLLFLYSIVEDSYSQFK